MFLFLPFQIGIILLYWLLTDYNNHFDSVEQLGSVNRVDDLYEFYSGIAIMMLIGFGWLMSFLRRHCFAAIGFTLLVTMIAAEWVRLCLLDVDHRISSPSSSPGHSQRWLLAHGARCNWLSQTRPIDSLDD